MRCSSPRLRLAGALLVVAHGVGAQTTTLPINTAGPRLSTKVYSFLELRERNLIRQGWDISCGAAALSTVLTYHFGAPYSEATIAASILANTDPDRVRARGGFSLLDLKRFAEAVGFSATGYGNLTLADLATSAVPVILPVSIRGLDHFVVFRGLIAEKVLIGDPAFGNLTMSPIELSRIWPSGIGFFVTPVGDERNEYLELSSESVSLSVPDLNYVYRLIQAGSVPPGSRRVLPTRLPSAP
jgi:predicted double-glycine peptidase